MKRIWVIFSFFVLAFCLTACTERVAIINGVDEREANEIIVFLASKGINADKQMVVVSGAGGNTGPQMWNISVDPSMITEALAILNKNGLPRKQGQNLLQIFGDTGLVPTDMQQKIRYQAGLAQQIANTIRQIDGVIDATVQISIPTDEAQTITAAVYVKHQGVLDNPNSQLVTKIKQLVAGSVPGLKLENVTVISDRSRFTDVSLMTKESPQEENRDFVNVLDIVIAKNSIGLFRFYFILLFAIIILLVGILLYTLFRAMPYIEQEGGLIAFMLGKKKNEMTDSEIEASESNKVDNSDTPKDE